MVKPLQRAQVNQFVGGLVTEASPLTFPENASIDEVNYDMDLTGRRFRRLGMDVEADGIVIDSGISYSEIDTLQYNTYVWEQVAGEPGLDFVVVQLGTRLFLFKPAERVVSQDGYVGFIEIPNFPSTTRYYMSSLEGFLVVVSGSDNIAIVSYDPDTAAFSVSLERIKIRDLFGIEETITPQYETDPSYRGPINYQHYYNLYNQGWGIPRFDWLRYGNSLQDPVWLASNKGASNVPSNSDKVWLGVEFRGIGEDDDDQPINVEAFNYLQFIAITGAETDAARGYFIIDALRRGQSRVEQWNYNLGKYPQLGRMMTGEFNAPYDFTTGGPSCVADHAGRIWYSGFSGNVIDGDARSPNYNNYVFFSQIVRNKTDLTKCYQEGDPTSREANDVVDSDGGFVKISEANKILSMFTIGNKLVLIADNGVWAIVGGSDYGFSATNYRVDKLSTFGGLSASSVVVEGDVAYFWAADAIYMIGPNEFGDLTVQNLSANRIKTYYNTIPIKSKETAYGVYDIYSKRIRWIYRDNPIFSENLIVHELVLDIQLQAFFPFRINTIQNNPYLLICGFQTPPFNQIQVEDGVFVEEDEVYVNSEPVASIRIELIPSNAAVKYVGLSRIGNNLGIYFSQYSNRQFRDWFSVDGSGVDAKAYLHTGQQTVGDVAINKYLPYLTVAFADTEKTIVNDVIDQESSCIGRVQWDFSNRSRSGKWSRPMQLYRKNRFYMDQSDIDIGQTMNVTKTKIRGRGLAFSVYFETEEWKDCQIYGWVLTITGNGVT